MPMSQEEIRAKVNKTIREHTGVDAEKIVPTADFHTDLDCDLLDMVELTMMFEEDFNVEIRDGEAENVNTVQDAYDLLTKMLGA